MIDCTTASVIDRIAGVNIDIVSGEFGLRKVAQLARSHSARSYSGLYLLVSGTQSADLNQYLWLRIHMQSNDELSTHLASRLSQTLKLAVRRARTVHASLLRQDLPR
jgi:hypothetical protein